MDIPSDGEFSKPSFAQYITERLGGAGARATSSAPELRPMNYPILNDEFPGFMAQYNAHVPHHVDAAGRSRATTGQRGDRARRAERTSVVGPITYKGQAEIQRDIDNFNAALDGLHFEEAFIPAATPSRSDADPEHIYPSEQDVPLRPRRRDARGVPGHRRRGLRRATRPRPARPQPGACRASQRQAGRSCAAPPRCTSRRTTTHCAASPRTVCATTCAGAA